MSTTTDLPLIGGRIPEVMPTANLFDEAVWRIYGLRSLPGGVAQMPAILDRNGKWREIGDIGSGSLIDWPTEAAAIEFVREVAGREPREQIIARIPSAADLDLIAVDPPAEWLADKGWRAESAKHGPAGEIELPTISLHDAFMLGWEFRAQCFSSHVYDARDVGRCLTSDYWPQAWRNELCDSITNWNGGKDSGISQAMQAIKAKLDGHWTPAAPGDAELRRELAEARETVAIVLGSLKWNGDGYEWTGGHYDYRMTPGEAVAATERLIAGLRQQLAESRAECERETAEKIVALKHVTKLRLRADCVRIPEEGVPEYQWLVLGVHAVIELRKDLAAATTRAEQAEAALAWIRTKLKLPADAEMFSGERTIAGAMHVMEDHASGYEQYIVSYKCNDKQGEIARLSVALRQAEAALGESNEARERVERERDAANELIASMVRGYDGSLYACDDPDDGCAEVWCAIMDSAREYLKAAKAAKAGGGA